MGFFDSLGGGLSAGWGDFTHNIFGDDQTPGWLGTGQFVPHGANIDPNAYQIPGAQGMLADWNARGNAAGSRQAPTMMAASAGDANLSQAAQLDPRAQAQFRGGQMDLASQLWGQANGQGPSLAQGQLQQATDRNMQQALAMGATQQGMGSGGALRSIANQRASIGQQQAADSGMLRLQEQGQAQGLLSNVLGQGRGQDLSLAGSNAGFQQQTNLANQGARNQMNLANAGFIQQAGMSNQQSALQQQQMNDQLVKHYSQLGFDLATAQQRAQQDMQALKVQQQTAMEQLRYQGYQDRSKANAGLLDSAAKAVGSLL